MKEIFRACDIEVQDDKGFGLHHFFLNIQRGEILGILGNRYTGKGKLFGIMTADIMPMAGTIFFDGKKCDNKSYQAIAQKSVLSLSKEYRLIDGLTIWENVAILWKLSGRVKEYNHRRLYKMISLLLQDHGLLLDLHSKAATLTPMEKLSLEMIVLCHQKTRLILIDSFEIEGTTGEFQSLKELMQMLKEEGISFVFFSHQLSVLPYLANRITFLNKGRNIKVLNRTPDFKKDAEEIMKNIYGEINHLERRYISDEKEVLSIRDLDVQLGEPLSFALYSGEFTTIVTASLNIFVILQQSILGRDIIFLDMNYLDQLIEELSPMENLCLGLYKKVSLFGFEKRDALGCIGDDFYEWYGHSGMLEEKDSKSLYRKDRIAINLFRLKLLRKKVIICTDFNRHNDLLTNEMVRSSLMELLADGTAICMITGDLDYSDEIVDHYILLSGNKE